MQAVFLLRRMLEQARNHHQSGEVGDLPPGADVEDETSQGWEGSGTFFCLGVGVEGQRPEGDVSGWILQWRGGFGLSYNMTIQMIL